MLVRAVRAGRIEAETAETVMTTLIRVAIDEPEPHGFALAAMQQALALGLHVQDATYLETARRTGALLISADRAQLAAAARLGLAALPLNEVPARES